jgi:TonB family protein
MRPSRPRPRRPGAFLGRVVTLVWMVTLAWVALPLRAGGQEGPATATMLPDDTRLLRVMNVSQVERAFQEAQLEILPRVGLAGQSLVELTIGPDGRVDDARLVRTSGSTPLDAEAVRIGRLARFSSTREIRRPQWVKFQLKFQWKPVPPRTWPRQPPG